MKFLIITFALAGAIAAIPSLDLRTGDENVELGSVITDLINKTINSLIENLDEPLVLDDINVDENSEGLSGTIDVTNIKISGLKSLVATYIDVNLISKIMNITIHIPDINLQFAANVDVVLAELIPLYGAGKNSIDLSEIELTITGLIDIHDLKHIKVQDVGVLIHLDSATFNLNGLLNNVEFTALINTMLTDNVAAFINDNDALLSKVLGQIIEDIVNQNTTMENFESFP
ncbi:uncharacterized protein LOC130446075 [Diorhabda sublineata]|uniref:uncharacterized protein LOC130446075 n=1 Tax=Diorhabda sublineata TaxID=1163346 RepID=UPI0024E13B50|nr:uncharacterized protein LOC130446075 [Diorhabda sublineata]